MSLLERVLLWAFRGNIRSVVTIAVLFAAGMSLEHLLPTGTPNLKFIATTATIFLIFGVFLGVILVTEENSKTSGTWMRVACGAVAMAAIAVMLSVPWGGVGVAALVGAILGYAGMRWAQHV